MISSDELKYNVQRLGDTIEKLVLKVSCPVVDNNFLFLNSTFFVRRPTEEHSTEGLTLPRYKTLQASSASVSARGLSKALQ